MAGRVVVVGSINADLSVLVGRRPAPGETVPGDRALVRPGGKGANQAVAAALLGADVTMVGAVGDDANAAVALERIVASGVQNTDVHRLSGATGLAVVVVDKGGENSIIVVPGANQHVDAELVERSAETISAAAVVVAQGEIPAPGTARASALSTGRFILNLAPVIDVPAEVIRQADPLVVNEHEAQLVFDMLQPNRGGSSTQSHAELADGLLAAGIASVVVTLGEEGALVAEHDGAGVVAVPAAVIETVDSTGAGDAFVGALATQLADGRSLVDAARFASRVGAFACTRPGAQDSYPGTDDVLPPLKDDDVEAQ